jgi:hypothetical protein
MKLTTIALAMTFALAGTFAVAQGGPNGTAGGPTSLSGTGSSTSGGSSPERLAVAVPAVPAQAGP